MYAQQRFAEHWLPQLTPAKRQGEPHRFHFVRSGLRVLGGLLVATVATILSGQIIGTLFGVADSGSQRLTADALEALVAVGVVAIGQIVSGRRQIAGAVLMIAGAIALWVAVPVLAPLAVLIGLSGVAILAARVVDWLSGSTPTAGAHAS